MTTNFLNPTKWQILVNNTDISNIVLEGEAAYSSCLDQAGLAIITGSMIVGYNPGVGIDIDDRTNTLWATGQEIKASRASDNKLLPVVGTTYIETSLYDINTQVNTINITCQLGLKNKWTPGEMGVCVNLDSGISKQVAITTLLNKAGVTHNVTGITGQIYKTIVLNENQSLVNLAGQLAFSAGGFLYQDKTGVVQFKQLNKDSTTVYNFTSPVSLQRLSNNAAVVQNLKVIGNSITIEELPLVQEISTSKSYGESGVASSITKRYVYPDSRIIKEQTKEYLDGALESRTTTTSYYETQTIFSVDPASFLEDCIPQDEAKIKRRVATVIQKYGTALAEFITVTETAISPAATANENSLVTAQATEEIWEYPANYNPNNADGTIQAGYIRKVRRPRGVIYPKMGDTTLGRGGTTQLGLVFEITPWTTEVQDDRYFFDSSTWSKSSKIFRSFNTIYPNKVISNEQDLSIPLGTVLSGALRLTPSEVRTSIDGSAPSIATFPALTRELIEEEVIDIVVSGAIDGANGTINLGDFWDSEIATTIIPLWQCLVNNKTKGVTSQHGLTEELYDIDFLELVTTSDCNRFYNYYIDNIGFGFNMTEAVIGMNGIFKDYGDFDEDNTQSDWQNGGFNVLDLPRTGIYTTPTIYLDDTEVTCDGEYQVAMFSENQTIEDDNQTEWDCATTVFITVAGSSPVGEECGTGWECATADGTVQNPIDITVACGTGWEEVCHDGIALPDAFVGEVCGTGWETLCFEDGIGIEATINTLCGTTWEDYCMDVGDSVLTAYTVNNICGTSYEGVCHDGFAFIPQEITTACGTGWACESADGDITSDKEIVNACGTGWEEVCHDGFISSPADINTACGTGWEEVCHDGNFQEFINVACGTGWECATADGSITSDQQILVACGTGWECAIFDGNTTVDTSNISVYGVDDNTNVNALTWDDGTGQQVYLVDNEELP